MSKVAIIIGRSEFLTDKIISDLIKLPFYKISINRPIDGVDCVAFIDIWNKRKIKIKPKKYNVLTLECNNVKGAESYKLATNINIYNVDNNELNYFGFTHDFVLSWLVKNKFDKVILAGAADFTKRHYDDDKIFNPSQKCVIDSINGIENIYSKHLEIYTLNKKSKLNVERITIGGLKKWH